MKPTSDLDRLRAWLDGRLDDGERARLERELDADPALAELAERLRDVFALTAAEPEPPQCSLTFEDIERRLGPTATVSHWPRRVAAAALLLGAGGLAWWALDGGGAPVEAPDPGVTAQAPAAPAAPPVVQLASLRAEVPELPADTYREDAWVPEVLADFDPRGPDGIAWLTDQRAALFVARAAQRPVLVLGSLPGCPWCEEMRAEVFNDDQVLGLADLFVPFEWDLGELPEKEYLWLRDRRGYPLLEVWSVDDEPLFNFSGRPDATLFAEMMRQGLESAEFADEVPDWADLRDWAGRWLAAARARAEGRVAEAVAAWRDLVRRAGSNVIGEQAAAALREVDEEAQAALFDAREVAAHDPDAAARALEETLARYRGTPQAADLSAVLEALRSSGTFPTLVEASTADR